MDLTRRQTIKLLGASAAATFTASASVCAGPALSGSALFDHVANAARDFHVKESAALLDGAYAKVFHKVPYALHTKSFVQTRFQLPDNVRVHEQERDETFRFIWNFTPAEFGAGFYVLRDDDPRDVIVGRGLEGPSRGVRVADLATGLRHLTVSFQQMRETDAAAIFNTARTYDPTVGGDGVSILGRHPHDRGVWPNTFEAHQPLDGRSLHNALWHTQQYVDEAGLRISVRPDRLLVGRQMQDTAQTAIADFKRLNLDAYPGLVLPPADLKHDTPVVWDQLTQPGAWYVLTSIRGFEWYERDGFSITCEWDREADAILVTGGERRCFGCRDPRAVFGSMLPRQASV